MVPVPSEFVDPRPPEEPVRLGVDDPLAGLARWVAEGRVDAAATARARRRWLERQAAEEATLAGVLVDLGERGGPVAIRTVRAHTFRGIVAAVGADFVVVRQAQVGDIILPIKSVATVRGAPRDQSTVGTRPLALVIVLAEALVELAADRPEVRVSVGDDEVCGQLRSAGHDVLAIALGGSPHELIQVAMAAIDHVVVVAR